jgi:outer membrane protein OmpA-like peptidoglycan-associated protein
VLKAHPEIKQIQIEGHTDDRGSDRANQRLSQRRADSVMKYLVNAGIESDRLTAKGFGESTPIADNKKRAGREKNRRVEFKIVSGGGAKVKTN